MKTRWRFLIALLVTIFFATSWSAGAYAGGGFLSGNTRSGILSGNEIGSRNEDNRNYSGNRNNDNRHDYAEDSFNGNRFNSPNVRGGVHYGPEVEGGVVAKGGKGGKGGNVKIGDVIYNPESTNQQGQKQGQGQDQGQSQFGAVLGVQKGIGSGNDTEVNIGGDSITYKPAANGTPVNPPAPTAECLATWGGGGGGVLFTGAVSGWKYSVPCLYGELARSARDNGQREVAMYAVDQQLRVVEAIAKRNGYETPVLDEHLKIQAATASAPSDTADAHSNLTGLYQ